MVNDYLDKAQQCSEPLKHKTDTSKDILVLVEALGNIIKAVDKTNSKTVWGGDY